MPDNMNEFDGPRPTETQLNTSAETEPRPKVFFVYRDNELYGRVIPKVVKSLTEIGYQPIVHAYPLGTPEEQIAEDIQRRKTQFTGAPLFTDGTVQRSWPDFNKDCKELNIVNKVVTFGGMSALYGNLDEISQNAALYIVALREGFPVEFMDDRKFMGPEGKNLGPKVYGQVLTALMRTALSHHRPENIYIEKDHLSDHDFRDFGMPIDEAYDSLVQWLVDAGYERNLIKKTYGECDPDTWVIVDRHAYSGETLLNLPLGDFIESLKKNHLLDENIDPEEMDQVFESKIKEFLGAYEGKEEKETK